jgi:hypothetical protein
VRGHPEDELDVVVVPAVAQVVGEEAPAVVIVLCGEEDAHAVGIFWVSLVVVAPDDAKIQRTGRGHDSDVRQRPPAVVVGQAVDGVEEELVARHGAHGVVGDACRGRLANPRGVGEERVEAAVAPLDAVSGVLWREEGTHVVQVDVDASKMVQHEVAYGVGALDGVRVAVEGLEEPRVSAAVSRCTLPGPAHRIRTRQR